MSGVIKTPQDMKAQAENYSTIEKIRQKQGETDAAESASLASAPSVKSLTRLSFDQAKQNQSNADAAELKTLQSAPSAKSLTRLSLDQARQKQRLMDEEEMRASSNQPVKASSILSSDQNNKRRSYQYSEGASVRLLG